MAIALSGSSSDGKNIPGTSSSTSGGCVKEDADVRASSSGGLQVTVTKSPSSSSSSSSAGANESKESTNDMVGGCAVCLEESAVEGNPLVYCDGCNLSVHQACYGILNIPEGSWYCCRCKLSNKQDTIKCELCPVENGALKKTETNAWAHVLCALYIPEVDFGNKDAMEPIILAGVLEQRWDWICHLCEESGKPEAAHYGAKIECNYRNSKNQRCCNKYFHVTCAQAAQLLREESIRGTDTTNYNGYCKNHFRKLKAPNSNNKKKDSSLTSNPNSASMLDSASDSSQDNDSRRNNAIGQDKNNSNRTKVLPNTATTNTSQMDSPTTTTAPTNISQLSSMTPTTTASKPATPLLNLAAMGLTVPPITISGNGSRSNTGPTSSTTPKKKRTTKSTQAQNNTIEQTNSNNSKISPRTGSNKSTSDNSTPGIVSANPQDVYDWPAGIRESEKNTSTTNKPNRKKPVASSTQSLSSKSVSLTNPQAVATSYGANKVGSPNLSISTSPSLASPSSSTKSTSNASTTVTATATSSSSSSSSTTSSSPSPAQLSPNMSSNRGSATRQESPLASYSKTTPNMSNKLDSEPMLLANNVLPALNPLTSTRINLDNLRPDLKKSLAPSSSLLSTTVPMPTMDIPMQLSMGLAGDATALSRSGAPGFVKETIAITSTTTSKPDSAQPTIPPLILPVPQESATTSPTKPAPKTRAPARSTKKKAPEVSAAAVAGPKPEPKPKPSRSRKVSSTENGALPVPQKVDPKAKKGKASAKAAEAIASSSNTNKDDAMPKAPATSGPNKRKSRAASAESNPSATPSPAKRIRKKKTDATPPSNEPKSTTQTALALPTYPQSSMSHPAGPGPLMISTPAQNNPLPIGFNPADSQSVGTKYFSPMVSPYTNYDGQMAASSLSRSSLSRLFTSSSSGANSNPTSQPLDDPTKAFDDLRDYSWSALSKCVLDQAQQFDIPMLFGTLHTLRAENDKLQNRVRDLTLKREQLTAMNARLDLPPQLLTQNLANTNPNFSSIVSSLTNSPKGLPIPSPGSALAKQPLVITSSYNLMGPGHLGPSGFMDRSSPLVAQTHSTVNNIKSSSISTPSPPINALMAAHNSSTRAGLTVHQPYMPNSYPQMNVTGQINSTPQGPSFYARQ